jgi:transposase
VSVIYEFMTDKVWQRIGPLLPDTNTFGRPRCADRDVLEGILWVLKTGARWRDVPKSLPSASTCWRRLRDWEEDGVWDLVWRSFISQLDAKGVLDWEQCFMDGSFAPAKKGGSASERPRRAKEQSGWWWRTARVFLWEAPFPRHRPQK